MSVYIESIPNLLAGVSQQASQLRLTTQGEVQINGLSSLTKGLGKRPPAILSKMVGAVAGASNAFVHDINRDATEQYIVLLKNGSLKVYDRRTGVAQTVNFTNAVAKLVNSLTSQGPIGNGTSYQVAAVNEALSVVTTNIAGGAVVLLQESSTGAFAGEEVTRATITTNTTTAASAMTNGYYYRCRKSVAGTGSCTAKLSWSEEAYLIGTNPRTDFAAVTVADHTFVVNKTVTTAMDTRYSPTRQPEALVHVIAANYGKGYHITIDGTERGQVRLPDGSNSTHSKFASTTAIAYGLDYAISTAIVNRRLTPADFNLNGTITADNESDITGTAFVTGSPFVSTQYGNVLHIYRTDSTDFTISSTDGNNNVAMKSMKSSTQRFSDLPVVAPADYIIEITGESSNNFDNFYVRFDDTKKVWKESMPETTLLGFKASTMPHILVREADGTFSFKVATWDDREIGDEDSNPQPSFIGQTIRDVFNYRNRLGFVASENAILSRSGSHFNFWRSTVTVVLDTDPIDIGPTTSEVAIINYAIPMNDNLILFSDQVQSRITGGELLSPRSVANHPLSFIPMDANVRPALAGDHAFFCKNLGASSTIHEYWVDLDAAEPRNIETTNHCPGFVLGNIISMEASRVGEYVGALSSDDLTKLYLYKYYWSDSDKVQSAWSYWQFATGTTIAGFAFFDTDLVIVAIYDGNVHLLTCPLVNHYKDMGVNFPIYLDHRVISTDLAAGTYDAALLRTSYTLPYTATGVEAWTAYDSDGPYDPGLQLEVDSVSTTTIRLTGNTTAQKIYFGLPYTFTWRFSDLYVRRESSGRGTVPVTDGRTQVLRMSLKYADTAAFTVSVTPEARNTFDYAYSALGSTIDDPDYLLDSVVLEEGVFTFPVKCQNTNAVIELTNAQALPCWFLSADWLATYQPKHKRTR